MAAAALALTVSAVPPAQPAAAATCPSSGGVAVPTAATPAGAELVVRGHGWGHSLGMSQYGAEGAAKLGCSAAQILSTYYPGTHVTASATLGSTVILTLLSNQAAGHSDVTAQSGVLTWLAVTTGTKLVQPTGSVWHVVLDKVRGGVNLLDATNRAVLHDTQLRAAEGSGVTVPNVARVRSFGGSAGTMLVTDLQLKWDYTRFVGNSAGLSVAQVIVTTGTTSGVEKYLWGIGEVPVSWPAASLQAQAIAARTYLAHGSWSSTQNAYVIGTTSASQNYTGYAKEAADAAYANPPPWHTAVNATAHQVVVDSTNKVIDALYTSSHGGRSEDVRYVWGSTGFPYLVSVDDSRWEMASDDPADHRSWAVGFTRTQAAARFGLSTLSSITVGAPGTSARLSGVTVTGTLGGSTVTKHYDGWDAKGILGLLSPGMTFAWASAPDVTAPVATASAGPAGSFHWGATDAAPSSGIAGYDVTVQHGTTTDWSATGTTATSRVLVGTPGTTYQVTVVAHDKAGNASAPVTATTTVPVAGTYHAIVPFRLLDTRSPGPALSNGQVRSVHVDGVTPVPAGVTAVAVNVTVTQPTASGYLVAGDGTTGTSNLNFSAGDTRAALMVLPVDASGAVRVTASLAGTVDVILDVQGYFTPDGSGGGYTALSPPVRVADSRVKHGIDGAVASRTSVSVPLPGAPAGATVAAVQVTAVGAPTGGYLSVGALPSATSNLNYPAAHAVGNLVLMPIQDGAVQIYNAGAGPVQLVMDVQGYFVPSAGSTYDPVAGARVADSRRHLGLTGPIVGSTTATVKVAGTTGSPVPLGATVALVNVTVTGATESGYLVPGTGAGGTSALNYAAGQTVANLMALPVDASGNVQLHQVGSGSVQVVLDVQGYFD